MIPPIGSPCVLLIKVVPAFHREVRLTRFSRILYEGKLMGRLSFARALARDVQSDPNLTLELQADQLALKVDVDTITQVVYGAGLTPERLIIVYENDAILEPLDIDGMVTLLKRQDDGPRRMFQQLLEKYEECRQALQAFRQVMENHGDELQDRLNWIFETGAKLLDVEDGTTPVAD